MRDERDERDDRIKKPGPVWGKGVLSIQALRKPSSVLPERPSKPKGEAASSGQRREDIFIAKLDEAFLPQPDDLVNISENLFLSSPGDAPLKRPGELLSRGLSPRLPRNRTLPFRNKTTPS